jgi:SET domain-containing protein
MPVSNGTAARVAVQGGRLVATEPLPPGAFLSQYTGEVLTRAEMAARLGDRYQPGQKLHALPLGEEAVVDATDRGAAARLATHSCGPNTEVVTWMVELEGQTLVALATRSIHESEYILGP